METRIGLDSLVFGLDIGTRNVVGVVGCVENDIFKVVAMSEREHESRSMLDGQIHDIYKVGEKILEVKNDLEAQLDTKLKDVCIAAAGRVLKTINTKGIMEFDEETRITKDHVFSMELQAIENAHKKVNEEDSEAKFFCVGHSAVRYLLNGFEISNLEGHKAKKIEVDLIATFLPEEVVDSLYMAVEHADLKVASLTLEPIAAINIAVPENFRLLNLGLVDVGAGTSDICLTKDGSIIAFGMIPVAGDEITEAIARHYLVDFKTAEQIKMIASSKPKGQVKFKDVMGIEQKINVSDINKVASEPIGEMAKETASRIKELNGGKSCNAVFVVGGGGKMSGYTQTLAKELGLPKERVAVRGADVLESVDFSAVSFQKDSLYVTPIGICTNFYNQKNNFVFVSVNESRVKLYDNNHLTISDALVQIGYSNNDVFPKRGKALSFSINGVQRQVKGKSGEGAVIKLNGKPANLNSKIGQNAKIEIKNSTAGEDASLTLNKLEELSSPVKLTLNGELLKLPKIVYVNGETKPEDYDILEGDHLRVENYYTVKQLCDCLGMKALDNEIFVNGEEANPITKIYSGDSITASSYIKSNENASNPDNKYLTLTNGLEVENYEEDIKELEKAKERGRKKAMLEEEKKLKEEAEKGIDLKNIDESSIGKMSASFTKKNKISNDKFMNEIIKSNTFSENIAKPGNQEELAQVAADMVVVEKKSEIPNKMTKGITIFVNNEPVKLSGKSDYILVDLFQFYEFDLSKPKGVVVLKQNGNKGEYTAPLKEGDKIDLYWEDITQ
ncbi:cell division protein FtsA [Lachnospira pectinoschiza]|uniref:Cell division protein FtsA n=1 Tax=Lachnospira pectinoschiza TaxID=28052 RepID=A0A1G9VLK9_9FIRM|nr:cell division FtsA domain-containing protein [Lachnospira pectinoschiza]SDM73122.1 cell division protein FtsA [Lachnospira pectinoschiza]